jgi:uncharacterized protein YdeI (YjbR/CyaY-like superfamily)
VKNQDFNPKVDAYIAKAQPFAQPILSHVRELVHKACPDVEETIKWSMPFFELRGVILGHMAAFKQHCSIGFWGPEMKAIFREDGIESTVFAAFSASCQREYTDWIVEAKRPETKEKRVAQAVEWIAEGKQRNWKYQNC